jgi:hypothetical protein
VSSPAFAKAARKPHRSPVRSRRRAFRLLAPVLQAPTCRSLTIASISGKLRLTSAAKRAGFGTVGALVDCFPAHAAFPKWQEGRHPHCRFRGLLRLHSRYGPSDRSAAHRRPLSRGSSPGGYPHKQLASYRINRQLSGWILPLLMVHAFGAHCQQRTNALQQTVCCTQRDIT